MKITMKKIEDIVPYSDNPRIISKAAVKAIANSIDEFGFKVPIVIDKNNVIINGHGRLLASEYLGLKEVPTIMADDLTEDQVKAFRIADNKVSEYAEWDLDLLQQEMADISMNMEQFGFEEIEKEVQEENPYTDRIEAPFYEPTGNEISLKELVDTSKRDELVLEIQQADIPEDLRDFLIMASQRHLVFNYHNIADYYSNAPEEVQELMESSALVIIDFDDAIKNGYVKLAENISEMITNEDE